MTQLPEAALRAFLVRDAAETTRLTRQLGGEAMRDYQYLAYAALAVIAGWRFRTGYSDADVVRCVAAIRLARTTDGGESGLQPAMAEDVLRYALGQDVPATADHVERFRAAIVLLDALSEGALPGEEDADHLLTQARALAGRWAANDQSLPASRTQEKQNQGRTGWADRLTHARVTPDASEAHDAHATSATARQVCVRLATPHARRERAPRVGGEAQHRSHPVSGVEP